jgi:hypothetical protein
VDTRNDVGVLPRQDAGVAWPVSWSAGWVGALTALAVLVLIGLIAVAVGAHYSGPSGRILSWRDVGILALVFSVAGAFFAFVAGGWVAVRLAGIRRAEPAILHGAIAWLVAVPLLLFHTAAGAGNSFGTWYGGLGTPVGHSLQAARDEAARVLAAPDPSKQAADGDARAARNSALGAFTALILGLVGSVLGGWMACGEPMSFTHYYENRTAGGQPAHDRNVMSHT